MNKEEFIAHLEKEMFKYFKKCRNCEFEILKTYYLGRLYKASVTYKRLTGKEYINPEEAYWYY